MKRKVLLLIISTLAITLFVACDSSKAIKKDTPANTTLLLDMAIKGNNYERFNELFTDSRKNVVSKEILNEFNSLSTSGTDYNLYEVLTYTNGEMFLVNLVPIDGEYQIQDIVKVEEDISNKIVITKRTNLIFYELKEGGNYE